MQSEIEKNINGTPCTTTFKSAMTFASRQVHLTDECIGVILLGLPVTIKVRKTYCPIFLEIAEIYDIALIPSLAKPYTIYQQTDHIDRSN